MNAIGQKFTIFVSSTIILVCFVCLLWKRGDRTLSYPVYQISHIGRKSANLYPVDQRTAAEKESAFSYSLSTEYTSTAEPSSENYHIDERLIRGEVTAEFFPCPSEFGRQRPCQYYKPDWKNREDVQSVLTARINQVRERCRAAYPYMFNASLSHFGRNSSNPGRQRSTMFMVNSRLKLAFAWMPKMGSSFWKRAWGPLSKAKTSDGSQPKAKQVGRKGLGGLFKEITTKYKDYTVYTIARSPWDRLVSVYREKCEKQANFRCTLGFGKGCMYSATFEKWLNCTMTWFSTERTEYYGHTDMTYQKSGVCDYPYTFIVLMENMAKETAYLFKQAGVADPLKAMNEVRNRTIRPVEVKNLSLSYTDYWKNVSQSVINRVRFYYRYEIWLYGYPETPFFISPDQSL